MALITDLEYISSWMGGAPYSIKDEASSFYFSISSSYLSGSYDLEVGDKVEGEILAVKSIEGEEHPDHRGRKIEFVMHSLLGDNLFISKKDWEENFREYGLVTSFYLSVRLKLTLSNYHVIARSAVSQSPERSEGDEAISNEGIASLPPHCTRGYGSPQ